MPIYLPSILDAFTKQILSYVVSDSLEVDFVLDTVTKLINNHGSTLQAEAILHSDQGFHYTSYRFIEIIKDKKLRQSMSRRGNCWDNAPQVSFHGHMKDHIGDNIKGCKEFAEVKEIVDNYIGYYNNSRYQWELESSHLTNSTSSIPQEYIHWIFLISQSLLSR